MNRNRTETPLFPGVAGRGYGVLRSNTLRGVTRYTEYKVRGWEVESCRTPAQHLGASTPARVDAAASAPSVPWLQHRMQPQLVSRQHLGQMQAQAALECSTSGNKQRSSPDWPVLKPPWLVRDASTGDYGRRKCSPRLHCGHCSSVVSLSMQPWPTTRLIPLRDRLRVPRKGSSRRRTRSWRQTPFCRLETGDGPIKG